MVSTREVEMERKEWVLLALFAAEAYRLQPVQLQKSLFLLGQNVKDVGTSYYDFMPFHYGPFSIDV